MIVTGNLFLQGASGRAGNLVVKQYKDKTVISAVPDMSRRKLTDKQKHANEMMKWAIQCAKNMVADPRLKEKACVVLDVPSNKVFRAIVKHFLLTDGEIPAFKETPQQKADDQTLETLKKLIVAAVPDAEIRLYGNSIKGAFDPQSDWEFLILTGNNYPGSVKWELQEQLFNVTIQLGTRINILLVQKDQWETEKEYEMMRNRIGDHFLVVNL